VLALEDGRQQFALACGQIKNGFANAQAFLGEGLR
jgi:hypothetical protein